MSDRVVKPVALRETPRRLFIWVTSFLCSSLHSSHLIISFSNTSGKPPKILVAENYTWPS